VVALGLGVTGVSIAVGLEYVWKNGASGSEKTLEAGHELNVEKKVTVGKTPYPTLAFVYTTATASISVQIVCEENELEFKNTNIVGGKAGQLKSEAIKLKKCKVNRPANCSIEAVAGRNAAEEIITERLKAALVSSFPTRGKLLLYFEADPEFGTTFMKIEKFSAGCGLPGTLTITGRVLAEINPSGAVNKSPELIFPATPLREYENEAGQSVIVLNLLTVQQCGGLVTFSAEKIPFPLVSKEEFGPF
jgi:hypothetical protein